MIPETAVEIAVGRVSPSGWSDDACLVRRVRGPGLQTSVTPQRWGCYQMRARSAGALYMGVPSRMSQAL